MPFIRPGPRAHERARRCTVCVRAMRARIVPERGVKDELDRCAEGAADGELGGGGYSIPVDAVDSVDLRAEIEQRLDVLVLPRLRCTESAIALATRTGFF